MAVDGTIFGIVCLIVAAMALLKGEPLIGVACLIAGMIVYYITQDGFSFRMLR